MQLSNNPNPRQSALVSAPLDFLKIFAAQLRGAGIEFAITSGMACVHYGLQQTTKDSDWIIPHEDLEKLLGLFARLEGDLPTWRVSYRQICGAPLDPEWMQHGWTSHLSVWDNAGSVEHKVDIFSKPPRVKPEELKANADGWASEHVVAQMKKTDRDKDWPIVNGLGSILWKDGAFTGLLHINHPSSLLQAWSEADTSERAAAVQRRPLLSQLAADPPPSTEWIDYLLSLERKIWELVNYERHSRFTRNWRRFYRQWQHDEGWQWPTSETFRWQHERLVKAARLHQLEPNPMAEMPREALIEAAARKLLAVQRYTQNDIACVMPPTDELMP